MAELLNNASALDPLVWPFAALWAIGSVAIVAAYLYCRHISD